MASLPKLPEIRWQDRHGQPLTCHEKLKVLSENVSELQDMAQDVLEEALILGVDERQIRDYMSDVLRELENPYDEIH